MRIYRLTAAGSNALRDVRSVPDWYRAILELVRNDATIGKVITGMRDYPSREVLTWIEQLATKKTNIGAVHIGRPVSRSIF